MITVELYVRNAVIVNKLMHSLEVFVSKSSCMREIHDLDGQLTTLMRVGKFEDNDAEEVIRNINFDISDLLSSDTRPSWPLVHLSSIRKTLNPEYISENTYTFLTRFEPIIAATSHLN